MPVKNEGWILETTLSNLSPFVDLIIVADQNSTDNTLDICNKYPNVKIIVNNNQGHSNKVRWTLLEEARAVGGQNLIICLDADELISKSTIEKLKSEALRLGSGCSFSLHWIQLWKGYTEHRVDGEWKNNYKTLAFYDDGTSKYNENFVINDHTSRIPEVFLNKVNVLNDYPLLHFHFVAIKRSKIKQAWYKCSELIDGKKSARYINHKYSVSDGKTEPETTQTPSIWTSELNLPEVSKIDTEDNIRVSEIMKWFDTYGLDFFEPLDIWRNKVLLDHFIVKKGRYPKTKEFPAFLVQLKKLINKYFR